MRDVLGMKINDVRGKGQKSNSNLERYSCCSSTRRDGSNRSNWRTVGRSTSIVGNNDYYDCSEVIQLWRLVEIFELT